MKILFICRLSCFIKTFHDTIQKHCTQRLCTKLYVLSKHTDVKLSLTYFKNKNKLNIVQ